ncbi:MAG TPA: acyl-CoA dehydrogenase family protein [Alphaproteobacteria bacterium]|nr:acyl-CoA dehydrogenase family protein [Alphaproteobacteria bacterium]
MDFGLSEEQRAIRDLAREFAAGEIAPHAARWDEEEIFPTDTLRKAAGIGFAAIYAQPDHGGSGLGRFEAALIFEELAAACVSTAAYLSIQNLVSWMVDRFGSNAQRRRYLPKLASLEWFASYCLTEPGSGSDAAALKTRAERTNHGYRLTGSKAFISGGGASDLYLVMARTGEQGAKGISAFLVEKGSKGLSFGKPERKLGWRNQPTAMVLLDGVEVPDEGLLGAEGEGFSLAMQGLDGGRVNIGACALGGARASLEAAGRYMQERMAFGRKLAEFQALQFRLADMATDLDAARLMVHRAASSLEAKRPEATLHAAMAKRFATDICYQVVDEALQLHGGYGYLRDFPVERFLRDMRVLRILEGTNEIMRLVIARRLLAG